MIQTLGIIFVLIAISGIVTIIIIYKKKEDQKIKQQERYKESILPTDRMINEPVEEKLKVVKSKQVVTLIGGDEREVKASISFHEMTQLSTGASWSKTGNASKALVLAGQVFIFKMPSREGGKEVWLKAKEIETFRLQQFYVGTKESFGPAKQFHKNGQTLPVPYELPNNLTPGITWEVVDIGTLDVEVDGNSKNFKTGDRLYFVTSNERGGEHRLLYLDARQGESRGTGGLFICEPFEPSVEVSDLL